MPPVLQRPLTAEERAAIVLAVQATFTRLRDLHDRVRPLFESARFDLVSPTTMVRDLGDAIERALLQQCPSFSRPAGARLQREGRDWELRVSKDSGLTIPRARVVDGDHFLVVNYRDNGQVAGVWVLWDARDHYFSSKRSNSHARTLLMDLAAPQIEVLQFAPRAAASSKRAPSMVKASLPRRRRLRAV